MSHYKELVINESERNRKYAGHGIPFIYSQKLMKYLNPINQGQYYTIGGRMSGGKRSFTDLHFVFGAYIWWYNQPEESRPPLRIFYYNMDKSPKQKLQKMLCTYLWLFYNQLMDTNTLNGMHSRMFGITKKVEELIANSEDFFSKFFDVVDVKHGPTNPTGIYHDITRYANTIGEVVQDGFERYFKYDTASDKQITLVVVDNVKKLTSESKKGERYNEHELHQKMNEYFVEFRDFYKFTPVAIVPSWDVTGLFRLSQMIPDFREFRNYFEDSNVSLHLFNPYKFQIEDYNGWKSEDFVSEMDNVPRFRVCSILRNTDGGDSSQIPMMFMPENGMLFDLPSIHSKTEVNEWTNYVKKFKIDQINQNTYE